MLRTHTCGELTEKNIGQKAVLYGWVDSIRDHGGLTFIDLRDRYGKTQAVASAAFQAAIHRGELKTEDCVRIEGKVARRPKGTENPKLVTGEIEVVDAGIIGGTKSAFHSASSPLPFEISKSRETNEELRMEYRFLDLRNPAVQKNILIRHRICQIIRRTLDKHGFVEVETPILTKSTPEGARDYLVPSRLNQGEFYALPQSPQLFKQILMVSGLDRYFQIAKCFRDEDLRADRQPEFTQLDMEMSFLEEDDLFSVVEELLAEIFREVLGRKLKTPFPRMTYREAVSRYGSDKPDPRPGMPLEELSDLVKHSEFKVFKEALARPQGAVSGVCLAGGAAISRKEIDDLTESAKKEGASGLAYFKVEGGKLDSPIAKFFDANTQAEIIRKFNASAGDMIFVVADERERALKILGALRLRLAQWKHLIPEGGFHFSWVLDFPLFKWNEEAKCWESEHHPFTSPHEEDWKQYRPSKELGRIRSRAYDLVLNGNEIASGSVRIHKKELQQEIFETIGLSREEAESRFGFLLKAFEFGAPPHGGIALGLDRLVAIFLGLESIREAIAFPKNQRAVCPMTEAPSPVGERQLRELGIKIR